MPFDMLSGSRKKSTFQKRKRKGLFFCHAPGRRGKSEGGPSSRKRTLSFSDARFWTCCTSVGTKGLSPLYTGHVPLSIHSRLYRYWQKGPRRFARRYTARQARRAAHFLSGGSAGDGTVAHPSERNDAYRQPRRLRRKYLTFCSLKPA